MSITESTINAETPERHIRKYRCRNPLHRLMLSRFFCRMRILLDRIQPVRVLDFGCGEGFSWLRLAEFGPLPRIVGVDLRADALREASTLVAGFTSIQT